MPRGQKALDLDDVRPDVRATTRPPGRVVRVVPDVAGIAKRFDYVVPARLDDQVEVGTVVRIDLHGRRVAGWVVEVDVETPPDVDLKELARVTGVGPSPDLVALADWAAWRWAGRPRTFLRAASPPGRVRGDVTRPPVTRCQAPSDRPSPVTVRRVPPAADRYPIVTSAIEETAGDALVLCPSVAQARALADRLRRDGRPTALVAHDQPGTAAAGEWARAAAGGCTVVGARAGAWAPVPRLGQVVVLDEHDEAYAEEGSPTWHARDVVLERAARAEVPVLLVSSNPTLEALAAGVLVAPERSAERRGWPALEVVDRREEDPAAGMLTEPLAALLRRAGRVLCVVNRTGRSRLSACAICREVVACATCEGPVIQPDEDTLRCTRCGTERPVLCHICGSTRFRVLRPGVSRLREELAALVGEPVDEVTGAAAAVPTSRVVVGTEAVLHRVTTADAVAFLDIDQELLAPRERAREQAFALLARAARLVRGREEHGRLLVQTRRPEDVVIQAALHADPARVAEAEAEVRRTFRLSPFAAVADVSGVAAPAFVAALGRPPGIEVQGGGGAWRIRADDHTTLCAALAAVERPPGRLRIDVDPLRA
ncbi:MAG TPA: hypothetical protein VK507_09920 [Iamia sp.]|nr:hypothetical protein [Iamia sp.]